MGCPSIAPGAKVEQDVAVMLRTACSPSQTMHPVPGSPKGAGYRPLSLLSGFVSVAMECQQYVVYYWETD